MFSWLFQRVFAYVVLFFFRAHSLKLLSKARKGLKSSDLLIVTASDWSHEKSLIQLAESVRKFRPQATLIAVDLGLSKQYRERLEMQLRATVVDFPFSSSPPWFRLDQLSGSYAWKPKSILLGIDKARSLGMEPEVVLWMDAGCEFSKSSPIFESLTKRGAVFANLTRGKIGEWTLASSCDEFSAATGIEIRPETLAIPQVSAAAIGFNLEHPMTHGVLSDWAALSGEKKIISPDGADKNNHRFDQSVLSLLLATKYATSWKTHLWPQRLLDFRVHQDVD